MWSPGGQPKILQPKILSPYPLIRLGMSSEHSEVKALLRALAPKIERSKGELTSQQLGNGLYGLQRMGSEEEVVRIIQIMQRKTVASCDLRSIHDSLYGLLEKDDSDSSALRETIVSQLQSLGEAVAVEEVSVVTLTQSLHLSALVEKIPRWLSRRYEELLAGASSSILGSSETERRLVESLLRRLPSAMKTEQSKLIDGFELDLYFPQQKYNLEVDGPQHCWPSHQLRDRRRDQYLEKSYGIKVRRLAVNGRGSQALVETAHELLRKDGIVPPEGASLAPPALPKHAPPSQSFAQRANPPAVFPLAQPPKREDNANPKQTNKRDRQATKLEDALLSTAAPPEATTGEAEVGTPKKKKKKPLPKSFLQL